MNLSTTFASLRKTVAGISLVAIVAGLLATGVATAATEKSFSDVPSDAWYSSYVNDLVKAGVVDSTKDMYRPGDLVNRAEMVKFAFQVSGLPLETAATAPYKDVPMGQWYTNYVHTMTKNGVVSGDKKDGVPTGYFRPSDALNRAEATKMLVNAAQLAENVSGAPHFPDVKASDWFYNFVETAYNNGVVAGYPDGMFKASNNINRAEAAKMVSVAMKPVAPAPTPSASGDLKVMLASDSPTATSIPSNASAVEMMKVVLTAASSDVTVKGLTVHKSGVSSLPTGFQGYIYNGSDRLTAGKSLSSSTDDMVFTGMNVKIAKGSSVTLTLKTDMGDITASGKVMFQVKAVDSTAATVGGLPVNSAEFDLSTTDVGTLTVNKNGTIANPKVGQKDVTIAKFKLTASSTEAAVLKQFGLYIAGTISTGDVVNLKLWASDKAEPIATVAALNSKDIASFVLATPYSIEKGGTKSFSVTADLSTGRNADTLKAYIDEKTDVVAMGDKYGFGQTIYTKSTDTVAGSYDGTSCTSASGDCTYSALEGGDVTISSSGPAAADIAVNGKDVRLLNFNITSLSPVTFKNFDVGLIASVEAASAGGLLNSTTANFTDIKISKVNKDGTLGAILMGAVDVTSFKTTDGGSTAITEAAGDNAQAFYLFTDEFSMAAGESLDLALTADVANNSSLNNETLIASLQLGSTYPEIRDVTNKVLTNTSSLVPSADITGKTMTAKSAGLTLSLASTPVTDTYVKGAKNVKFVGINFACATGSNCKVTDLTLTGYLDDNGNASAFSSTGTGADNSTLLNSYVGSVRLEDNTGKVLAANKSVQSGGTVVYSNLNWVIKSGETQTAYVVGDLSSNSFANSDAENIAFGISSTSNVTAENSDGNSISSITNTVNTTPSTYVTTSAGGSLTVAVDAATPKENILVAGAADQAVSKFKFTSTDEAFVVTKLSINNRQSAATTAALGDYDNNVTTVKITYTNSAGVAETKSGTLTSGTAEFSGMDMLVKADDDAVLTVSANLNTISAGATAAEFVDLNVGFNNFEAVAQGSGETYKAGKLDAGVAAASDLDFGSITYTDGGDAVDAAIASLASLSASQSVTVDDDAGATAANLPVGTILCIDEDSSGTCSSETVLIVTSWTNGATEDTVTTIVADDAGGAAADGDNLLYSLPGSGYLTASNHMHVYESKPTIALTAGSPSGARSVAASDDVFLFTIGANAQEAVTIRAAVAENDTIIDGLSDPCAISTVSTAGNQVDGTSALCTVDAAADNTSFSWDTDAIDLSAYARVNFWVKTVDTDAGGNPLFADFEIGTGTTDSTFQQEEEFTQSACGADQATMVTTEWYNCDLPMPTGTDSGDLYFHISFEDTDAAKLSDTDLFYVDSLKFYNEKLVVDVATDTDLDTYANNSANAAAPSAALLKEGGSTVATAYWSTLTNGASATTTASAVFIPTTDITIAKGTSKNFTLTANTGNMLAEDAGSDDPVTFSIDLGTASAGTVTAGDFWWYETNSTVKWLGQVANNTLNSGTLVY